MVTSDTNSGLSKEIVDVALPLICLDYEHYRFYNPQLYTAMRKSVKCYGQITPVVTRSRNTQGNYELLDGFKRYHALHDIGKESIRIHILPLGEHASKIAMINFNTTQRSISVLEESLIVTSLYREDKLNQVQIGVLLGKGKSWVCRRMALCERLSEEVVEHLRLGLICMSQARELSRLPRGNQLKALNCVLNHRLCSHETQKLVTQLIKSPRWEHDILLRLPLSILDQRTPPREKTPEDSYSQLYSSLVSIETIDSTNLINSISGKVNILQQLEQKITCTIQHLMTLQTNLNESTIHANSNDTQS